MCGIARIIGQYAPEDLEAMVDAEGHCGPDGRGFYHAAALPCHRGHCRLAILDLSDAAGQPMSSADWQMVIVFNGEIYNHQELRGLVLAAVSRGLMSDVPLRVFLSGGVDSSGIAAAMSRLRGADGVQAFPLGFTEPSFDESTYAATHCGLNHHVSVLDMTWAMELIPELLGQLGELLGDSSLLPTWLRSSFTRQKVTVALSGDAGDELFAGYDPFLALRPAAVYSRLVPGWLHTALRHLVELLPSDDANMSLDFKPKRTLRGLSQPETFRMPAWMGPLNAGDMGDVFARPLSADALYEDIDTADGRTAVERCLLFYTRHYLPDDILTKVDRAAMPASLESRAVFFDNDVVAFCQKLPQEFKPHGGIRKFLLKKAFEPWLPDDILYRKKKGCDIPLNSWLRAFSLRFMNLGCPDILDTPLNERVTRHQAKRGDERGFLWAWLSLQQAMAVYAA
jgi:asparagine synthase (glutamine-hydrolysing)